MGFVLGGETAWKVRAFRDLGIAYHWVNGEPSVVLYPLYRHLRQVAAVPYVLPLPNLHEIVKQGSHGEGVDSEALLEKARTAALVMGLGDDFQGIRTVADAILDSIVDLVNMPPEPTWHQQRERPASPGEITVRAGGQVVFEGKA